MGKIGDIALLIVAYPIVVLYLYFYGDGSGSHIREMTARTRKREQDEITSMRDRKRHEPKAVSNRSPELAFNAPAANTATITTKAIISLFGSRPKPGTHLETFSSAFLSLPVEIREQIYAEVLGNDTIHITQLPNRLGHIRCNSSLLSPLQDRSSCNRECFPTTTGIHTYRRGTFLDHNATSENSLALLQTCRQTYNEASWMLYETNTFEFNHPQSLVFLARTLRSSRLASIRHLSLTWSGVLPFIERDSKKYPDDLDTWEQTWRIIGQQIKSLQTLRLRMLIYDDEEEKRRSGLFLKYARKRWTTNEVQFENLLKPMKKHLRNLREFRLAIDLPEDIQWNVLELESRLRKIICIPKKNGHH